MEFEKERETAIKAVVAACHVAREVKGQHEQTKSDHSPVTLADLTVQAVISRMLGKVFPDDTMVGEEQSGDVVSGGGGLLEKLVEVANKAMGEDEKPWSGQEWMAAIDRGGKDVGGSLGRQWVLDPIDGTKGYLRGGQYAICLALLIGGNVKVAAMGCPNFHNGTVYVAVEGQGAFQRSIIDPTEARIHVSPIYSSSEAVFCESVEAGHSNHDDSSKVSELLGITNPPVRMDSQCKYASISRGDSSIYLRLPTIKGYEEKIWDHASGYLLVHEAGGKVTDIKGKPLNFSIGRTLKENVGVIATNGKIHDDVVKAVNKVLYPEEQ